MALTPRRSWFTRGERAAAGRAVTIAATMFLAIDIGNTRLKWALYAAPQPGAAMKAHGAVFLETIDTLAEREWKGLPAPGSMLGCNVAGDAVRRRVEEQLEL